MVQLGVVQQKGESVHVRSNSVFIVDLDRRIQHISHYPLTVGKRTAVRFAGLLRANATHDREKLL